MAGAELVFLQDELDAGGGNCGAYAFGFVADDAEDVIGGDERLGRGDDVEKKGAAADLVEDFGALAFEPRALARGHDCYCETGCIHARNLLMLGRGL